MKKESAEKKKKKTTKKKKKKTKKGQVLQVDRYTSKQRETKDARGGAFTVMPDHTTPHNEWRTQ